MVNTETGFDLRKQQKGKEMKLDTRQVVPLTSAELSELRQAAESHGLTAGLFARALLTRAVTDMPDDVVAALADDAKAQAAARTSAGAREAIAQRWGGDQA